jgi:hypothetical protein
MVYLYRSCAGGNNYDWKYSTACRYSTIFTQSLISGMLRTVNTCTVRRLVAKRLPVLNWLPYYKPSIAVADLVAGITVGLTLIPQAIAYASLAGLHAQVSALKLADRSRLR